MHMPSRLLDLRAHDQACTTVVAGENDFAKAQKGQFSYASLSSLLCFAGLFAIICELQIDSCGCSMWIMVINNASTCACVILKIAFITPHTCAGVK